MTRATMRAIIFGLLGVVLLSALVSVVYLPSLNGEFILDDDVLLTNNRIIRAPDGLYQFWFTAKAPDYWPVSNSSLWIEWRLWSLHPTGYRITNLIIHIASSLLIWVVLRKLSIPGAFLAAMIFAIHPVNVESVAWIAQRKGLLAMLFFLLSVWCYLKLFNSHPSYFIPYTSYFFYSFSLLSFILAMFSKGSVAILPLILLLIIWWRNSLTRRDIFNLLPFFVVAVILTGVNIWFQTHGFGKEIRNVGYAERFLCAADVVWFYLFKAVVPLNLMFVYPQWQISPQNPLCWLPLLSAVFITGLFCRYRNTWGRNFLFAWGFYCIALAPVLGFVDVGYMKFALAADHYQYIAIIGAIALPSAAWGIWHQRAKHVGLVVSLFIAFAAISVLALLSWRQSGLYRDAETLYTTTLQQNPESWMMHNQVGFVLSKKDQLLDEMAHYREALRLNPDFPEAHYNMAGMLIQMDQLPEAIEHLQKAVSVKPSYVNAHYRLGNMLVRTNQPTEAIEHYQAVLQIMSDHVDAHNKLAAALLQIGKPVEAVEHYKQVLAYRPDYPEANYNLGNALLENGQIDEAIKQLQQSLQTMPEHADTHNKLGVALFRKGNTGAAIIQFQYALKIEPNAYEVLNNLGIAFERNGRVQEAIAFYWRSIRLKPDYTVAYYNLAVAYDEIGQSSDAISAAKRALKLARSQRQNELHEQINEWLNSHNDSL